MYNALLLKSLQNVGQPNPTTDTIPTRTSKYRMIGKVASNTPAPPPTPLPTDKEIMESWKKLKSPNDNLNQQIDWKKVAEEKAKKAKQDLDNKISDVTSLQKSYILSPLYKQRASKFKNPNVASAKALQALQELKTEANSYYNNQAYPSKKLVTVQPDVESGVIAHEFSHMTGARPRYESGTAMGLNYDEQAEIMSRNKNVQKVSKEIGKPILSHTQLPFQIDKTNTHIYSPWENKADIEGMRFLFYKNGITKKYGENISPEQLKKALENPKIKNDLQIKRLKQNFEDKDIIHLNNTLAKINTAEQKNLA